MTDKSQWKSPCPAFTKALCRYERTSCIRLKKVAANATVVAPLYHYTNCCGLKGIIEKQELWFTHYKHLNDKTELTFGIEIANDILTEIGTGSKKLKPFCDMVIELLSSEKLSSTFDFYIASFSRNRDSAHQWKNYAQNGEGFAIGFAPNLFAVENKTNLQPHENVFVAPVCYGDVAGRLHHLPAIKSTANIVAETVKRKCKAMADINKGMPFFDELGKTLIASELILNCLTLKHESWRYEEEVRAFILGETSKLCPHKATRVRGAETVPFIKSKMPIQQPGSIAEIVIGPAAPCGAEKFVASLLEPFHPNPRSLIRRSNQQPDQAIERSVASPS